MGRLKSGIPPGLADGLHAPMFSGVRAPDDIQQRGDIGESAPGTAPTGTVRTPALSVALVVTAAMLFLAALRWPYAYYEILRIITCGTAGYAAYSSARTRRDGWVFVFGVIALLFNPFVPVRMTRAAWGIVDPVVAILMLLALRRSARNARA